MEELAERSKASCAAALPGLRQPHCLPAFDLAGSALLLAPAPTTDHHPGRRSLLP